MKQILIVALCVGLAGCASQPPENAGDNVASEVNPAASLETTLALHGERFAIDHLFFFSDVYSPELAYAEQQGFWGWWFDVTHTGQGTGGRYMRFDNVYIEYLWVEDADAARANAGRARSDFATRAGWRDAPVISPFGLGLRDYAPDEPLPFGPTPRS